jgi:hypothetical protein
MFTDSLLPVRVKIPRFSAAEMENAILKCGGKHLVFQLAGHVLVIFYFLFTDLLSRAFIH